jgi:hypothetical protein
MGSLVAEFLADGSACVVLCVCVLGGWLVAMGGVVGVVCAAVVVEGAV